MSIEDFFSSTCKVRTRGDSDEYGEPLEFTVGAAKSCRFDPKKASIGIDDEGKNIIVDGFVYMLPEDAPGQSDELEINGDNFRIMDIMTQRGESDPHHVKVAVRKVP